MALWGVSTTDESKPKWLTAEQKKTVFATDRGWVQLNGKGNEEVICAIGELAGVSTTTGIGAATITSVDFVTTSFDVSDGGNIDVRVIFNEKVTVDTTGGTPSIVITNSGRWWFCSNIDCNLSVWFFNQQTDIQSYTRCRRNNCTLQMTYFQLLLKTLH